MFFLWFHETDSSSHVSAWLVKLTIHYFYNLQIKVDFLPFLTVRFLILQVFQSLKVFLLMLQYENWPHPAFRTSKFGKVPNFTTIGGREASRISSRMKICWTKPGWVGKIVEARWVRPLGWFGAGGSVTRSRQVTGGLADANRRLGRAQQTGLRKDLL